MTAVHAADAAPLVVVGDVLLDVDLEGRATRLCPDDPAPVLESLVEVARPGGAGLAALIAAAQQSVVLVTGIGDDAAGERLRAMLGDHVSVLDLGADRTVTKTRVRAGGRTLLRMDHEGASPGAVRDPDCDLRELFMLSAAVLVSDYGLGMTGRPQIREALRGVPRVVWDPHPRGAEPVPGVTTVTPNLAEARHFAGTAPKGVVGSIRQGQDLLRRWRPQSVTVTRGSEGAVLVNADGTPLVAPAPQVVAGDVCGAGDAFAAGMAGSLGRGRDPSEAVCDAVHAAADYLQRGGVAGLARGEDPVRDPASGALAVVNRVRAGGGQVVMAGGCFDLLHAGHVSYLQAARALGDCLVVALNSDESVRRLKGPSRPVVPAEDRARVLQALGCVDAVEIFEEATPERLLRTLQPDIFAKGGDYHATTVPEAAVVQAYGGEVVVLPTLAGRSSTRLVSAARAAAHARFEEEECRTQPA